MLLLCYAKCTTCQKAKKWLAQEGIAYEERPIKEQPPTIEELRDWIGRSGLPIQKFFNTSGQVYRSLGLKDKLPDMSEEEQIALLASDGMLVKRPLLVTENRVFPGFREPEWRQILGL